MKMAGEVRIRLTRSRRYPLVVHVRILVQCVNEDSVKVGVKSPFCLLYVMTLMEASLAMMLSEMVSINSFTVPLQ